MIFYWLNIIFLVFLIMLLGMFVLAVSKDLIKHLNNLLMLALSWLTGCVVITVSYLILFFISFTGLKISAIYILLLPLFAIIPFHKTIKANLVAYWQLNSSIFSINRGYISFYRALKIFFVILVTLICIEVFWINNVKPSWALDSWLIWSLKARLLYFDTFDFSVLKNGNYSYAHLDYPLLVPFLQALFAKFIGVFDERLNQTFFSVTYVSFIIIFFNYVKWFFRGLLNFMVLIPIICLPVLILNFMGAYADCILFTYHLMALYFLYLYLFNNKTEAGILVPVVIGLIGMLMTKNEGFLISCILFIASVSFCKLFKKDDELRVKYLLIAFGFSFLYIVPWFVFNFVVGNANDIVSLSNLLSLNIFKELAELPTIMSFLLFDSFLNINSWGILFYVFILLLLTGLAQKRYCQMFFFGGSFVLFLIAIIVIYILSPHDLIVHLHSSADRVILTALPLVICYIVSVLPFVNKDNEGIEDLRVKANS